VFERNQASLIFTSSCQFPKTSPVNRSDGFDAGADDCILEPYENPNYWSDCVRVNASRNCKSTWRGEDQTHARSAVLSFRGRVAIGNSDSAETAAATTSASVSPGVRRNALAEYRMRDKTWTAISY
jgi:hypothetical protein